MEENVWLKNSSVVSNRKVVWAFVYSAVILMSQKLRPQTPLKYQFPIFFVLFMMITSTTQLWLWTQQPHLPSVETPWL